MRTLVLACSLLMSAAVSAQTASFSRNSTGSPVDVDVAVPNGSGIVLNQSTDPGTITAANSVSCNAGGLHADNSYYRRFDLDGEFSLTQPFSVSSVDVAVETATAGAGGSQPIQILLHTIPNAAALSTANLTQVGMLDTTVADAAAVIVNFAATSTAINPATDDLVVEVFTPDGQTEGHAFFIGSNTAGQTAPSFIFATDCGIADITDLADIGFATMHIVLLVNGTAGGGGGPLPDATQVPTLSTWGLITLALILMFGTGIALRRRHQ